MSITNTFDNNSEEIIFPVYAQAPIADFPEVAIVVFTHHVAELIMQTYDCTEINSMYCGRNISIYKFTVGEKSFAFYQTLVGGAGSASLLEEVIAMGAKKVLFFGSCGSLDSSITAGHLLIPYQAYRDEGASYHYMPESDYIDIPTAQKLSQIMDKLNVPHIITKIWTTDAFYRETRNNAQKRKNDGCAAVDMECASVMAVAQFRGIEAYEFVYAADCLDGDTWDQRILGNLENDMRKNILNIAINVACLL